MTDRTPQRVSLLPIGKALSTFDAVVATTHHPRWDVAGARRSLTDAAIDGFVETGLAKRLLRDATRPSDKLIYVSNEGVERIKLLWDRLKTIPQSERDRKAAAWRRGLERTVSGMMSTGLVSMRYVAHPRFNGHVPMTPEHIATIGVLADALHDMPAFLERQDRTLRPVEIDSLRSDLSRAGRAIERIRSW